MKEQEFTAATESPYPSRAELHGETLSPYKYQERVSDRMASSRLNYIDELCGTGEFKAAEKLCESYFALHEGAVSKDLFTIAQTYTSLPYQEWMFDEDKQPTPKRRQAIYDQSVHLASIARESLERASKSPSQNKDYSYLAGSLSETLFYATAARMMAAETDVPLVIVPAPSWLDSSSHASLVQKKRDGVDFIAYYYDLVIPIQVKTRITNATKSYREEILVVGIDQLMPAGHNNPANKLCDAFAEEVATHTPNNSAIDAQNRLFARIEDHALTHDERLRKDNIALLRRY